MFESSSWNQRYAEGSDRWTLERVPAVLEQLIAIQRERHRVLIPGAGVGHDAFAWARAGHEVVALDFAPLAVESMRARASELGVSVEVLEADVTAPPEQLRGVIDLVWEQTCLCALPPDDRRAYLEAMATILRPSGSMIALLWNHGDEGGPPFDMPPVLVEQLVAGVFAIRRRERVADGLSTRANQYLWWLDPIRR
ncbi:methyltransferase domain-containing protein [Enhygromyxa salina]|uniref:Biotin biosynthesis protein BioC n=1 Tax=Enhygromyxa salina TaxID=215803 RepID=A0A2S9YJ55_9BACT|nr:methyltransferase domain-containing protein [Enhygromyxa salina]PRQ05090.1 biotin biosynthesis protein BioC [Enhygromyxa salina]